jgi:hypothetical protein
MLLTSALILASVGFFVFKYGLSKNATYQIAYSGRDVMYQGQITDESGTELLRLLESAKANRLFVNSYGGSTAGAMKIGSYIAANSVQVIVVGICYSACANYFFLPSKNRAKTANSILGMHGGFQSHVKLHNAMLEALPEPQRTNYAKRIQGQAENVREEIRILELAGINPKIIEESANRTSYGDIEYIETEPAYFKLHLPAIKNSPYDLWFPAAADPTYVVPMTVFEESLLPIKFAGLLRNYLDEAKRIGGVDPKK